MEGFSHGLLENATKQFEDTKTQIGEFKGTIDEILSATSELRLSIQNLAAATGQTIPDSSKDPNGVYLRGLEESDDEFRLTKRALSLESISVEVAKMQQRIIDEIAKEFPPPDHAPSHANREIMVDSILEKTGTGFIDLMRAQGLTEEELENLSKLFENIRGPLKKLTVLVGELGSSSTVVQD